ncbi:MAG: hypothetical protein E3J56_00890 [Candidatus Aminicenantes bacterium]|nr:MAG: hypothetical protein E3J56_00890 [Candidatus Aminicenantes bacterium]
MNKSMAKSYLGQVSFGTAYSLRANAGKSFALVGDIALVRVATVLFFITQSFSPSWPVPFLYLRCE